MVFTLESSGNLIIKIPIDFIGDKNIEYNENKYSIKLPFGYLIGKIHSYLMGGATLEFSIETSNEISDISLMAITYLVGNNNNYNPKFVLFNFINEIHYGELLSKFGNVSVKGLLIKHEKPIKHITIGQVGTVFIDYDEIFINLYTHEIDNNLTYVPFNSLVDLETLDNKGSVYLSEQFTLDIECDDKKDIKIYQICNNILLYIDGSVVSRYLFNINIELKDFVFYDKIILQKLPENTECMLTYIPITENDFYWKCDRCVCICDYEMFLIWVAMSRRCPCCQLVLHKINKYQNTEKIEDKTKEITI